MLPLALMLCVATQVQAADVDLATAQNAARAFMNRQIFAGKMMASAASNLQLVKAEPSVAKPSAVDYYIFNGDKSYIVIAGDDKAPEVLMYGMAGKLDINNIPPAMQWLLNKYKFQIDGLKAGTREAIKTIPKTVTAIAPMVTATWDQTAPYYNQCPKSGNSYTLTGCPATSLSMCYYKWKWPETFPAVAAISSSSYGVAASALAERAADWDNIIDHYGTWYDDNGSSHSASYNTTQANAVAWLMRYTGQAIPDYMYGTSASGANDPEILEGCHNMGYTDAQLLVLTELQVSGSNWNPTYSNGAQQYTDAQWNEFMMNELQNGRPIEYLAYDSKNSDHGGHAFNVFGCDSNGKYYVNWGWSGSSNGYCTLHNFTTANGSTSGSTGSYIFNWGEAMIIGIEPPAGATTNPRISTSTNTLDMAAYTGESATATFTVTGANLTGKVNVTLTDANGVFSVNPTSVSVNEATNGKTVTVTFSPQTVGTYTGTIKLTSTDASDVTVTVNGTATLKKENIVLQEAANVASTSFQAVWTDQTPAANVASYTLWVKQKEDVELLGSIDGSQYTGSYTSITLTSPWGGSGVKGGNNAVYFGASGNITFTIPQGYNNETFTVRIQTVTGSYGSGNITVKSAQTAAVGHNFSKGETYTWLVTGSAGEQITLTTTDSSYSPDMALIEVYAGDATQLNNTKKGVAEEGDETYRIVTGITAKNYTVNNLTPEATYYFKVKAIYTDGTESSWSDTKQVTLLEDTETPTIIATPSSVDFGTCYTAQASEQTFTVTGRNLTGNITATLTDANNVFALNTTTVTTAEAANGKAITVTFTPAAVQSYTGSIKLTSAGAADVIINLTGAGTLLKAAPVMAAADENYIKYTSFRADWTDETPEANVESYTLWVNTEEPEPEVTLLEQLNLDDLTAVVDEDDYLTNVADNYADYLPEGWTIGSPLYVADGYILIREQTSTSSCLTSPTFTLPEGCDKITVKVIAAGYDNNSITTGLTVSTVNGGSGQTTVFDELSTWYECTFVLDANSTDQIILNPYTDSSQYWAYAYIGGVEIYAGDITENESQSKAPMRLATEEGDSTARTITGITDKFYTVKDLAGGGTFNYKVKAVYVDGTESAWSNVEQVTLNGTDLLRGDVNADGKVDVTDVNIAVNIILGKETNADYIARADMDGNGNVDVTDVNQIVNIILGKNTTTKAIHKNIINLYRIVPEMTLKTR